MSFHKVSRNGWLVFGLLVLGSGIMLFPFVWMVLSSFKSAGDVYTYPPKWIPSQWNFSNYAAVFRMIPFLRYYFNSIYTSLAQTAIQIFLSITAAYALTKLDFPGKNGLINLIRSTMFVPLIVTLIPLYLMFSRLGLVDTYSGIILPQVFSAFTTFLLMSFFVTVPNDLCDSAKLDGCGYYRIMTKVVVPNSTASIGTATMFSFLAHWKSYTWPLIITNKAIFRTLPIGLKYLVQESSSEYQVMMAASVMAIVPVLIIFMFSERQLVRSVTLTGLKS